MPVYPPALPPAELPPVRDDGPAPAAAAPVAELDDRITIADGVRGLLHDLRNQITGLVYYSNLLKQESAQPADSRMSALIGTITGIGNQMFEQSQAFFEGSFFELKPNGRALINPVMAELSAHCARNEGWAQAGTTLAWVPLGRDATVAVPHVRLVHAVRHLLEYCFARAEVGTRIGVTAELIESFDPSALPRHPQQVFFCRHALAGVGALVRLTVAAQIPRVSFAMLRREFHHPSHDFRFGSLMVFGSFLSDDRCAFAISRTDELTRFDLYLPVAV